MGDNSQVLRIASVTKLYGDVAALSDVTLTVPAGSITAVLGPSGSGKTTLLNVCAGVVRPTAGRIVLGAQDITDWPAERRGIGVVFQSYALFPHLSVLDNVAFSMRTRRHRQPREKADGRAREMLKRVGLSGYEERRPQQLSGGQQQRVALARALVFGPQLMLLDEPLTALDAPLRDQLQQDIRRLRDEFGVAILYVTHNVNEALVLADNLVILDTGRVVQSGPPREVYERPQNAVAAAFVGEANFVGGAVQGIDRDTIEVNAVGSSIRAPRSATDTLGRSAIVMVRPEKVHVSLAGPTESGENVLCGVVRDVAFLGSATRLSVELAPGLAWRVYVPSDGQVFSIAHRVRLRWRVADTVVLDASNNEIGTQGLTEPVDAIAGRIA